MVLDGEVGASSQNDTSPLEGKEVSDDSSICLGSYSDAEDIIENENGISNTTCSKENTNCLDNIISEEYDDEETIPQLPPVDAKLAVVITKWLHVLPPP